MTKAPHRWFLVSLVHPALSVMCLILGSTISGGSFGWLGYATALLAFLANIPGVLPDFAFFESCGSMRRNRHRWPVDPGRLGSGTRELGLESLDDGMVEHGRWGVEHGGEDKVPRN
jgi:hypothetical protein